MLKLSKLSLWIIIFTLTLIVVILIVFVSVNGIVELRDIIKAQQEDVLNMEQKLLDKDFSYTACKSEIDNLEQIISDKDELIVELQVKEEVLKDVKSMLEYSLTYIHFVQIVMANEGLHYPDFIIESVLNDEFFEMEIVE